MVRARISLGDVQKYLNKYVKEISYKTDIALEKAVEQTSKNARQHIKEKTIVDIRPPYNRGVYVKSYRTNKLDTYSRRLRNEEYRLSHLLEKGHMSANQFGKNYTIGLKYDKNGNIKNRPMLKYEYNNKKKTHKFGMWKDVDKFIGKELPQNVKKEIKKI